MRLGLWTGFANCGIISHMDQGEPIPGTKASSAIERWMRGLAVLALVGVIALATLLVAGLTGELFDAIGLPTAGAFAAFGAGAIFAPWLLGDRRFLRRLGDIGKR